MQAIDCCGSMARYSFFSMLVLIPLGYYSYLNIRQVIEGAIKNPCHSFPLGSEAKLKFWNFGWTMRSFQCDQNEDGNNFEVNGASIKKSEDPKIIRCPANRWAK